MCSLQPIIRKHNISIMRLVDGRQYFGVVLRQYVSKPLLCSFLYTFRVLLPLYSSERLAGAGRIHAIVRVHWVCSTRHRITGLNRIKPSIQPHCLLEKSHFSTRSCPHSFRVLVLCDSPFHISSFSISPFHLVWEPCKRGNKIICSVIIYSRSWQSKLVWMTLFSGTQKEMYNRTFTLLLSTLLKQLYENFVKLKGWKSTTRLRFMPSNL